MNEFFGVTAVGWQAIATMIALTAVVVTLIIGSVQLASARVLRLEQVRPYIVVDILPSGASEKLLDLVVTNIGKSPAYDLRITFDPVPERVHELPRFQLKDARILNKSTPMFAPGREFRMFFDSAVDRADSGFPMSFQVTAQYRDSRDKHYTETSTVDFDVQRDAVYVTVFRLHDAVKSLKRIAEILKRSAIATGPVQVVHEHRNEYRERRAEEARENLAAMREVESHIRYTDGTGENDEA